MGGIYFVVGVIILGMFANSPWLMTGIMIGIISLFIIYCKLDEQKEKNLVADQEAVREAVKFLNSYLFLCQKHSVVGHAYFTISETEGISDLAEIGCYMIGFDEGHAAYELSWIKNDWQMMSDILNTSGYENYQAEKEKFARYMREDFIGNGEELHWCFTDPGEYKFQEDNDDSVELSFKLLLSRKQKRLALQVVEEEVQRRFPNAKITRKEFGLMVRDH